MFQGQTLLQCECPNAGGCLPGARQRFEKSGWLLLPPVYHAGCADIFQFVPHRCVWVKIFAGPGLRKKTKSESGMQGSVGANLKN